MADSAARITFTNDCGRISSASNTDASIQWHCYERTVSGSTGIYVQRQVAGVLQAEVHYILVGERPSIVFDPSLGAAGKWILLYTLNERLWMITADVNDAPSPQPLQTTSIYVDRYAGSLADDGQSISIAAREAEQIAQAPTVDANNAPIPPLSVGIGSAATLGNFSIRWRAATSSLTAGNAAYDDFYSPFLNMILGFNVYCRLASTGATVKLNGSLIPFVGLDPTVYEYSTPGVAGTYFVTQVNSTGPNSAGQIEGLLRGPKVEITTDGLHLPAVCDARFGSHLGDGQGSAIFYVSFAPTYLPAQNDTFGSHLGDGEGTSITYPFSFVPFVLPAQSDTFGSHLGDGFRFSVAYS